MSKPTIKGVILAAGYGTRFLPVTKTIPKEMLPLVDVPTIQFIVDEFVESGIREILVITSRRKKSLEDYFDREVELEGVFRREGDTRKLAAVTPPDVEVFFVRQAEMRGTAHALALCEPFVGNSPFVVAYPDDILPDTPRCSAELIRTWRASVSPSVPSGCSVLSVKRFPGEDISRYGVVDPEIRGPLTFVRRMVEKPPRGQEPSDLVSLGRYLYTPDLFPVIRELADRPRPGEFYQTEPVNYLAERGLVACCEYRGRYLDVGKPSGYLRALLEYALTRDDLRRDLSECILSLADNIQATN